MLYTTTITVKRPDPNLDPYDAPGDITVVAMGIRAHIGAERGGSTTQGSQQQTIGQRLDAEPCDLIHGDTILDERTGSVYRLEWVENRRGLGLDHMEGGLVRVSQRNPVGA